MHGLPVLVAVVHRITGYSTQLSTIATEDLWAEDILPTTAVTQ